MLVVIIFSCCLLDCYDRLGVSLSFGRPLFTASSSANLSLPGYGHLHSGLGTGAWCAETQDANQYLQVWISICYLRSYSLVMFPFSCRSLNHDSPSKKPTIHNFSEFRMALLYLSPFQGISYFCPCYFVTHNLLLAFFCLEGGGGGGRGDGGAEGVLFIAIKEIVWTHSHIPVVISGRSHVDSVLFVWCSVFSRE